MSKNLLRLKFLIVPLLLATLGIHAIDENACKPCKTVCQPCKPPSRSKECSRSSAHCSRSCSGGCSSNCSDSCSESCSQECSGSDDCLRSCHNGACDTCCKCQTRTTFTPRQITFDATYELALNNYFHYYNAARCRPMFYFHAIPFFQKSHKSHKFAQSLLPGNCDSLTIQELSSANNDSFNSEWFGLVSGVGQNPFNSTISICPVRKTFGAMLYAFFDLCSLCDGFWASINFTPMRAEHYLNFRENNTVKGVVPGRETVADVLLNEKFVKFGKFFCGKRGKTGVDDVQLKFGWNWWDTNCGHAGIYAVVGAPTGTEVKDNYLFEPLVGSKHASAGFGVTYDYTLWERCNSTVNFMFDFKYRFVFKHDERRSFDLKNGEFSRFLPVVTPELLCPEDNAAAINFFSPCVSVEPRSTIDFWTALHWEACSWNLEFGYNLYWRDAEKICIRDKCDNKSNVGIFDLPGICKGTYVTSSTATLKQGFNDVKSDEKFTAITRDDLNVCSAAQPRIITNKIYAAGSYNSICCGNPWMIGLLGSFEFAQKCNALEQWAVAVNLSVGF